MCGQSVRSIAIAATVGAVMSLLSVVGAPVRAGNVPESTDPIVLGKLDWTGQAVTAEVAGEILRRMGYTVQFIQTTQIAIFQAAADGKIDAYLEQWNQTSKKYYDEYTKDGRIEGLGPTGLDGAEGWYYPDYVAQKCPGLPSWKALLSCSSIFATPDTAPKGRLLDYPAEWNPDAPEYIKALGVDLTPVNSGGEGATAAEVKSAVARQVPILLQWWEPTWLASVYKLKRVELDDTGEACAKVAAAQIKHKHSFDCTRAPIDIVKFAWPGLKGKWPAAYKFLKLYKMTNAIQGPLAWAVEVQGQKMPDVVKKWVDDNKAIWQPWVDTAMQ